MRKLNWIIASVVASCLLITAVFAVSSIGANAAKTVKKTTKKKTTKKKTTKKNAKTTAKKTTLTTAKKTIVVTTNKTTPAKTNSNSGSVAPGKYTDGLIGWAAEAGGTTGGGSSTPVVAKSSSELKSLVEGSSPKVILVSGNLGGSYSVGSNKTIIGLPGAQTGSWSLNGSSNVIMRNLIIKGGVDAVSVSSNSHHLWFDHLDLCDSSDENLSMKRGSDYITISWCKYWFSRSGGHTFGGLVGHADDNAAQDTGKLKITYHHNWYSNGVTERMPRVRFGKVHIFNNLFDSKGNNYVIRCGVHANIRSESNVFVNMNGCFDFSNSTPDAVLQSINDLFVGNCTGTSDKGTAFTPPYKYSADSTSGLQGKIESGAGATLKTN